MTRKNFLNNMINEILGYSIIELKKIDNDKVVYIKDGTLVKDCTYTRHYRKKVSELICSIFDKNVKKVEIEDKDKKSQPINEYRKNAKRFLCDIYEKNSEGDIFDDLQELLNLSLENLNHIYDSIIIKKIFQVEEFSKEVGNDDFADSEKKITKDICKYLQKIKEEDYNSKREAFFNAIANLDLYAPQSEFEIFYKSSELGKRYVDIKEYLKIKKYDFVILNNNNNNVTDFKPNTVYRYTGECFFEVGERNEIITYFQYNNQRIHSYTSVSNWVNTSILCNYVYTGSSRYFNCYFLYDQGRVFKFLQISEADIKAEI